MQHHRLYTPYLYLLLPALLMVIFFVLPLAMALGISLFDYSHNLYQPAFVGLHNYQALFQAKPFWHALGNTFLFLAGIVPAMAMVPIVMALLLNGQLRGLTLFRSLIYLPVVVPMVVVGIAWRWLYDTDGMLNWLLSLLHLPKLAWLVNPDLALIAVMLVVIWKGVAYYMMMYLAHLQSISRELYEAADMDGASLWRKHWHITLPHLYPTMTMVALISTIGSLKLFTEIYVLTRGGPVDATKTLVYYIYERAFENLDPGLSSAAGLVLMLILLGISAIQLQLSGDGTDAKPHRDSPLLPSKKRLRRLG